MKPIYLYLGAATLLAIPALNMLIGGEFDWSAADFAVAAVLLFGTAGLMHFAISTIKTTSMRLMAVAAIAVSLVLIWAELAVGIFGTPWAGS
jgi:hypothetical protein